MAAGLGFKTFNTGDVLSATDTNGYLMQGVLVFADAAARTAAITSPQEGQTSYLKDTDVIQVYSGSAWVTKSGGSPLTTKGDVYTYSTTDARIAVGANGTVLTADSAEATGLKWVSPATTSTIPYRASSEYAPPVSAFLSSLGTPTAESTFYMPIFLPSGTADRISTRSATISGSGTVRLGIYNADANNLPSTVLLDAGTVTVNASNTTFSITISQSITAGLYYLAWNEQTAPATANYFGCTSASINTLFGCSLNSIGSVNINKGFRQDGVLGAFGTASITTQSNQYPIVYLRMA
jgi:hypothetical protein